MENSRGQRMRPHLKVFTTAASMVSIVGDGRCDSADCFNELTRNADLTLKIALDIGLFLYDT